MSAKNSNKYSLDFFHSNPHNYGVINYIRKKGEILNARKRIKKI